MKEEVFIQRAKAQFVNWINKSKYVNVGPNDIVSVTPDDIDVANFFQGYGFYNLQMIVFINKTQIVGEYSYSQQMNNVEEHIFESIDESLYTSEMFGYDTNSQIMNS